MYKIQYLPQALENLVEIKKYLNEFSTQTSKRTVNEIKSHIAMLKKMPHMCEKYHDNHIYRRMVVSNYLVFYVVDEESQVVEIHRVMHHSRNVKDHL